MNYAPSINARIERRRNVKNHYQMNICDAFGV